MTEPRMTGTKICSKCERDLPVISFGVYRKNSDDGLRDECRECARERQRNEPHTLKEKEKSAINKTKKTESSMKIRSANGKIY